MATRTTRSEDQKIAELELKIQAERKKREVKRTRRAIVAGLTIEALADAGDVDAKRAWEKMLGVLTRKQDRLAMGLPPLPKARSDDDVPVNAPVLAVPPVVAPVPVAPVPAAPPSAAKPDAEARHRQAVAAWNDETEISAEERERRRVELGVATAGFERVSGQLWAALPAEKRSYYGLGERPGQLLR